MVEEQVDDSNNYGTIRNTIIEIEVGRSNNTFRRMMITLKQPFFFNILIFLIILFVFIIFQFWIVPTKRGFFCNDETIRYPFKPDTISASVLIISSILPNILMVFWGETNNAFNKKNLRHYRGKKYIKIMFQIIGNFLWGLILLCCFLNIVKVSVGRFRPYYLDVCKPDVLQNITCNDYNYILNYTCTGKNIGLIREASLSFPSGHSAISFFGATFFFLYIQTRAHSLKKCYYLPSAFQFTAITLAVFTAVSRIFDYHHHPEDVAVGIIIGILFGYYFFNYNMKFKKEKIMDEDDNDVEPSTEDLTQNLYDNNEMNV
uniref:AcidPPc domain-containing protein n=1 Tax=Strongyloides papillosus TaxID=174720 RepID=A0A0N5C9Q6_STREA